MKLPHPPRQWSFEYQSQLNALINDALQNKRSVGDVEMQRETISGSTRDERLFLWGPDAARYELREYVRLRTKTDTGTSYNLALADEHYVIRHNNASAITLNVPAQSSVAFPDNFACHPTQWGAGQVTVQGVGGVNVRTASTLKTRAQYSACTLLRVASDEWLFFGDME